MVFTIHIVWLYELNTTQSVRMPRPSLRCINQCAQAEFKCKFNQKKYNKRCSSPPLISSLFHTKRRCLLIQTKAINEKPIERMPLAAVAQKLLILWLFCFSLCRVVFFVNNASNCAESKIYSHRKMCWTECLFVKSTLWVYYWLVFMLKSHAARIK